MVLSSNPPTERTFKSYATETGGSLKMNICGTYKSPACCKLRSATQRKATQYTKICKLRNAMQYPVKYAISICKIRNILYTAQFRVKRFFSKLNSPVVTNSVRVLRSKWNSCQSSPKRWTKTTQM